MRAAWVRLLAVGLITVLVAVACDAEDGGEDEDVAADDDPTETTDDDGSEESPEPAEGEIDRDGKLVIGGPSPPTQWDPHMGRSASVDYGYHTPVYDSLLELTPELEVGPWLAEDWEVSEDGQTITMNLRDDVEFHDGEHFNAEVAALNLERARTAEGALTQDQLATVEAVEALDEYTMEIRLSQRDPQILLNIATQHAGRMVSPVALEDPDALATNPVGSGPYRLVRQDDTTAVYERVDGYWHEEIDARLPQDYERVQVADDAARYRAVQAGDIDVAMILGWTTELDEMAQQDEFVIHAFDDQTRTHSLHLNFATPGLDDPQVRRALNMAIDREALASLIGEEQCQPTASPLGHGDFPEIAAAIDEEYAYDPERARELLEEAGHADLTLEGLAITVLPLLNDVAVAAQGQLAEVGVDMSIDAITPAESLLTWREGNHDANPTSVSGYPDPVFRFNDWYYGANVPTDPPSAFVELNEEASLLPIGSEERHAAYERVGEYLLEDPLHAVLCIWPNSQIANTRVVNLDQQSWARLQGMPNERYLGVLEE